MAAHHHAWIEGGILGERNSRYRRPRFVELRKGVSFPWENLNSQSSASHLFSRDSREKLLQYCRVKTVTLKTKLARPPHISFSLPA